MNDHNEHDIDLAAPYVLDALSPQERDAYEAHLRSCSQCRAEVAELRQVVDVLPLACEVLEPPPNLRDRIVAAVEAEVREVPHLTALPGGAPERQRRRQLRTPTAALAAVAALIIVVLGVRIVQLQQRVDNQQAIVAFHNEVAAAISRGDTVSPVLGTAATAGTNAALIQPRGAKSAYLLVQGLPATPSQKVYQLWLMRGTIPPRSAGVFTYTGSAPEQVQLPTSPRGYTATAVTVEPKPHGSKGPTTQPILFGKLSA